MSKDTRCFINCDSVIQFVKDLHVGSYRIDNSFQRNDVVFIDTLEEEDCGEK
jgi:hypothetical protein